MYKCERLVACGASSVREEIKVKKYLGRRRRSDQRQSSDRDPCPICTIEAPFLPFIPSGSLGSPTPQSTLLIVRVADECPLYGLTLRSGIAAYVSSTLPLITLHHIILPDCCSTSNIRCSTLSAHEHFHSPIGERTGDGSRLSDNLTIVYGR